MKFTGGPAPQPEALKLKSETEALRKAPRSFAASGLLFLVGTACLAALAALYFLITGPPMDLVAEFEFIISTSAALIALYYFGLCKHWQWHRFLQHPGLIIPASALIFASVYKLGLHQFGGFDEGLVVHAASYYARGLRPFVDFQCSMPPLFMAGIRATVMLLGLHWASLVVLTAIFAAISSVWSFALLRCAAIPSHWALAITLCLEMTAMVAIPFWWYNNTLYIAVALLLLSVLACLREPVPSLPCISLALSLAMVLTSKPNGAIACLAVVPLIITRDHVRLAKTLSACIAALGLALLVCHFAQMPPFSILHSYAEVSKLRGNPLRFAPFRAFLEYMGRAALYSQLCFIFLNLSGFLIALFIALRQWEPKFWRWYFVSVVAALACVEMLCTNAEWKYSDLSILTIATALLCLGPWEDRHVDTTRRALLVTILTICTVTAGFSAFIHLRILSIGLGIFYEPLPTRTIRGGFFSGLEAGPRLQRVIAETQQVLAITPTQSVFFGPRMEFEYAVFNKPLITGMPLLWDEGNLYSPDRTPQFLLAFQKADPDLLIFLKNDYTHMGLVGAYIARTNTYQRYDGFPDLTVYVRRREVPVAYIQLSPAYGM